VHVDGAQQPAQRGADDEAQPEHGTQHAKALGAFLGCADVGHVGIGHRGVGLHGPAHQPHRHQHPQRGGQRGGKEVERQAAEAQQQHRPAAVMVGQCAQDGRAEEVGDGEGKAHHAQPEGMVGLAAGEAAHQRRQHGHDDADRHHVDQHGHHDEAHASGTAGLPAWRRRGVLHDAAHSMR
jgi:hypothetical protein